MKAKVTKAFPGVPDGEVQTREIAIGKEIAGDLARVAVEQGWAEEIADEADKSPAKGKGKK